MFVFIIIGADVLFCVSLPRCSLLFCSNLNPSKALGVNKLGCILSSTKLLKISKAIGNDFVLRICLPM